MLGAARLSLVPAIIAAWLFLPSTADAILPQVHDNGKFFSTDAVKKADAQIKRISEKYKKDVVIETFDKIPEDLINRFKYDEKNRDAFYEKWVDDLADRAGVNGIVVILSKDQFVADRVRSQVGMGKESAKRAFTITDRNGLRKVFNQALSDKKYDNGLLDGLQFIETTLANHQRENSTATKPAAASPASGRSSSDSATGGIWGWVCIGVAALLGIWLVVGLVRAFSGGGGQAGGAGGYGPGYGGGGGGFGGGGFMSGLMGGLFGAMAGNWLYNNMFGGHSSWGGSSAHAGESPTGGTDNFGPSDQGQGFNSAGDDIDTGGGGGDVGGGGGGDWGGGGGDTGGGGDWGGGGGDAGGGGGDWGGGGGGDFGGGGGGGDW